MYIFLHACCFVNKKFYSSTDATTVTGCLNYWFEWPQQKGRFLNHEGDPQMKILYLQNYVFPAVENNLHNILTEKSERFLAKNLSDNYTGVQMVTRSKHAALNRLQYSGIQVKITRKVPYEAYLIRKQQRSITRRRTINGLERPHSILKRTRSMAALATIDPVVAPPTAAQSLLPNPLHAAVSNESSDDDSMANDMEPGSSVENPSCELIKIFSFPSIFH